MLTFFVALIFIGMMLLLLKKRSPFQVQISLVGVCAFVIFLCFLFMGCRTHSRKQAPGLPQQVMAPVSEEGSHDNQLISDFKEQGVMLKEVDPAAAGIDQKPGIRQMNGSNRDCTVTLSIYQDAKTEKVKAYKLYTTDATIPTIKTLIKDVLPAWTAGPEWIDMNLDNEDEVSTTYQDAVIDLSTNRLSGEPGHLLQVYLHGYENL